VRSQSAIAGYALAACLDTPHSKFSTLLTRGVPHTRRAALRLQILADLLQWGGPIFEGERS